MFLVCTTQANSAFRSEAITSTIHLHILMIYDGKIIMTHSNFYNISVLFASFNYSLASFGGFQSYSTNKVNMAAGAFSFDVFHIVRWFSHRKTILNLILADFTPPSAFAITLSRGKTN